LKAFQVKKAYIAQTPPSESLKVWDRSREKKMPKRVRAKTLLHASISS
jgi:hypothetical protein